MKRLAFALALLLAVAPAPPAPAGVPGKALHEKQVWPTVRVRTKTGLASEGIGSAVVVSSRRDGDGYRNVALTVTHVVAGVDVKVEVPAYRDWSHIERFDRHPATVVRSDPEKDAAVIAFRTPRRLATAVVDWHPRLYLGNRLTKTGFGLDMPSAPRVEFGHVTSLETTGNTSSVPLLRMSAVTYPGDSGGGVFHEGKLVALTDAVALRIDMGVRATTEMVGYAIPIGAAFTPRDLE